MIRCGDMKTSCSLQYCTSVRRRSEFNEREQWQTSAVTQGKSYMQKSKARLWKQYWSFSKLLPLPFLTLLLLCSVLEQALCLQALCPRIPGQSVSDWVHPWEALAGDVKVRYFSHFFPRTVFNAVTVSSLWSQLLLTLAPFSMDSFPWGSHPSQICHPKGKPCPQWQQVSQPLPLSGWQLLPELVNFWVTSQSCLFLTII